MEVPRQNGWHLQREPSVNPPFLIDSSKDENPHDQSSTSDEDADDGENENEDVGVCFLCISLILTFGIRILYCINAAVYFLIVRFIIH